MIRFPRIHIAASVQNAILNLARDLDTVAPASQVVPQVPDASQAGAQLDQALQQPIGDVGAGSDPEGAAALAGATGGSASEAVKQQGVIEAMT